MSEENCADRFRKITERLYECLVVDISCDHSFQFGFRRYCSWLLKKHPEKSVLDIPCCRKTELGRQ